MADITKSLSATLYRSPAQKANGRKLMILFLMVAGVCAAFLLINAYPGKPKLFRYILSLRVPTLAVMMIAAFAIGCASVVVVIDLATLHHAAVRKVRCRGAQFI